VRTHVLPFFARSTRACERTYSRRDRLTRRVRDEHRDELIDIAVVRTTTRRSIVLHLCGTRRAQGGHNIIKRSDAETARDNQSLFSGCWPRERAPRFAVKSSEYGRDERDRSPPSIVRGDDDERRSVRGDHGDHNNQPIFGGWRATSRARRSKASLIFSRISTRSGK
jgi:hypothetical protein